MISRFDLNPAQPREIPRDSWSAVARAEFETGDERLRLLLPPLFVVLAAGFVTVAVWHMFVVKDAAWVLWKVAVTAAIVFLTLRLLLDRSEWLAHNTHVTASVGALAAIGFTLVSLGVSKAPWSTVYVAVAILCIGFLYSSRAWFYGMMVFSGAGWYVAAAPHLQTEGWGQLGIGLLASGVCAVVMLELRLRKFALRFETSDAGGVMDLARSPESYAPGTIPWCPVCKTSPDAIVRHDGENIVDANATAQDMLGLSRADLARMRVNGIFASHKRDQIASILRLGNFTPFETFASGYRNEEVPVEVYCGGLTLDPNGLRALVIRDLRRMEKVRQDAANTNRKAQLTIKRQAEMAALAETPDSAEKLDEILGQIVTAIHRTLPASIGAMIVLWDNEAHGFTVAASSTIHQLDGSKLSLDDEKGIVATLAGTLQKVVVENLHQDQFGMRAVFPHEPVKAFAAFPLTNAAGMIGFLLVLEKAPKEFSVEDLDFLAVLTHRASSVCNQVMMQEHLNSLEQL